MKKNIIAVGALAMTLGLVGCGSSPAVDNASDKPAEEQVKADLDFDGSGMSDTGAGIMYLSTGGGTSEDGNVPEIVADDVAIMQIGVNYFEGDGSVATVYVDGMENTRMNAGDVQMTIDLEGDALKPGTHKVEVVAKDGDAVTIYKAAEYKIVE